jgi:hypothetical protein
MVGTIVLKFDGLQNIEMYLQLLTVIFYFLTVKIILDITDLIAVTKVN